jgi:hypothetical protein
MRFGGLIEGSLIVEGYWFSSTRSNKPVNPWLVAGGQAGQSALVRNNVQLVHVFPTPNDPDTAEPKSDGRAQPGWGYTLQGASFGCLIEGNIISQAMLVDELGSEEGRRGFGINLSTSPEEYEDGKLYCEQNNTIRGNIAYRTSAGLQLGGDWSQVKGNVVEGNVFVADTPVDASRVENLTSSDQLRARGNRFYTNGEGLPDADWVGSGNTLSPYADAAERENWPDPDRTLKRYVTEELGLTLLEWEDDPMLDPTAREARAASGESYDPAGLKTFMAVATNMRRGGTEPVPASGKPSWTGDYRWDARFTGRAVVNWIRAGFGLPPTQSGSD